MQHQHLIIHNTSKALLFNPNDIDALVSRGVANFAVGNRAAASWDIRDASLLPLSAHQAHLKLWVSTNQNYIETVNLYLSAKYIAYSMVEGARRKEGLREQVSEFNNLFGANAPLTYTTKVKDAIASYSFLDCFMGEVLAHKGQHSRAIQSFDVAIAANPNCGWYFYLRGLSKIAIGDTLGGETDFVKSYQLGYLPHTK